MRISDWSSDVCSSDLPPCGPPRSPPPPLTSPGGSGGGGRALDRRSGGGANVALCVACLADERRQALDVAGGGSAPDRPIRYRRAAAGARPPRRGAPLAP